MSVRHAFIVAAISALVSPAVFAQCELRDANSATAYLQQISTLRAAGCFGGAADDSALTERISQTLADIDQSPRSQQRLLATRSALLGALRLIDQRNAETLAASGPGWREASLQLSRQIGIASEALQQMETAVPAALWQPGDDHGFFETQALDYLIDYGALVRADCVDAQAASCRQSVHRAVELNRLMALGFRVLNVPVRERIAIINEKVTALDKQWDYYFDETRSQYSWELFVNNAIYNPPDNQLVGPPTAQLVFFHPTIALEYVGSGPENESAYDTVGLVEIIGYNQWKTGIPMGASVVASYTPETTGDRVGYGLMLHIHHDYSIGVTRRDTGSGDDTTWLFSVDLTKLFLTKSADVRERFRFGEKE